MDSAPATGSVGGVVPVREYRQDRATLRPPFTQADGSLRIDCQIAEPGVYEYPWGRELVPAETLARAADAETLKLRPVTIEHPDAAKHPNMVTPDNHRELAVGSTGEDVRIEGGRPIFPLAVNRRDGLDWIKERKDAGEPVEVSPGYWAEVDKTPGVHPEFGPYDAVQVSREYNHLALTAAGRGGPRARARVDSDPTGRRVREPRTDGAPMSLHEALTARGLSSTHAATVVARLDSLGADEFVARLDADRKDMEQKLKDAEDKVEQIKADMAKLEKDKADAEGEDDEKPKMDAIDKAERLAYVDEVSALRAVAGRLDSIKDAGTLDADELRAAIGKAAGFDVPASMREDAVASRAYLQARIDSLSDSRPERDPRADGLRFDGSKRNDASAAPAPTPNADRFDSLGSYQPKQDA